MCPFGGLIAGYTLDKFGRKVTLILINIISIISWTLIYCSSGTNLEILYIQLMIARVLIGKRNGNIMILIFFFNFFVRCLF